MRLDTCELYDRYQSRYLYADCTLLRNEGFELLAEGLKMNHALSSINFSGVHYVNARLLVSLGGVFMLRFPCATQRSALRSLQLVNRHVCMQAAKA
eukprot:5553564-Pleurochrysis_carterae.AAC.3